MKKEQEIITEEQNKRKSTGLIGHIKSLVKSALKNRKETAAQVKKDYKQYIEAKGANPVPLQPIMGVKPALFPFTSPEYHPRKHTVQTYAAQNREAKKRRRAK